MAELNIISLYILYMILYTINGTAIITRYIVIGNIYNYKIIFLYIRL